MPNGRVENKTLGFRERVRLMQVDLIEPTRCVLVVRSSNTITT